MKVDLDDLFLNQSYLLLDYCLKNRIDLLKVKEIKEIWSSPLKMVDDNSSWILDVPDKHVTYLMLKGIL